MPSYREERDAVARVRNLRQSSEVERRKQVSGREEDGTTDHSFPAPVAAAQLPPISATYGDIMQLLGPTNYPAMLELFRGTSGLPDGVHPEVTVSFELFEAIQKRLVTTRDELDGAKKELFVKAQQLSSVQNEWTRCAEKNTALSRDLKQSEEMCLELRKYTSDVSILKQQHENEVINFKDEIAGMVSRLNFAEKQIIDSHHKLSESMVQLAQKDAVIASLRRGAKANSQSSSVVGPAGDESASSGANGDDLAATPSFRRAMQPADRMFQEQLKQHITQLEKEKRLLESEVRDVLDMHEGYRSHVENVVREYENQYMFYEDVLSSHQCADEFYVHGSVNNKLLTSLNSDNDHDANAWDAIASRPVAEVEALLHVVERGTNVMESVNDPSDECSFKLQVARCKDGAVNILQGSVEAVRLLEKLSSHMSSVISIGELRDTWKRVQSQWVDHVRRLVTSGVTALQFGLEGIQDKERVYKGNAMKEIEDKWVRVINSQYKLIMPTKSSEAQTDGSVVSRNEGTQVGPGFFVGRVTSMTTTAPRAATENRPTQTELQGTPSTSSLRLGASVKETLELDPSASLLEKSTAANSINGGGVAPSKITAVHSVIVQLAKVVRKLHFNKPTTNVVSQQAAAIVNGAIVDPLQYLKQLGQVLNAKWSDEVLTLDVLLLKATLAMITDEGDASAWLAAYQCHAELHRLERTVEVVGVLPQGKSLDTAVRADVANYPVLRRQLEDVVNSIAPQLDDGSVQKAVRVMLASDKSAVVTTPAATKESEKRLRELEAQLRIATAAAAAARPSSHQSARTPPSKTASPPPPQGLVAGSGQKRPKDALKVGGDITVKHRASETPRSPSATSSNVLGRASRDPSRGNGDEDWDLDEADMTEGGIVIPTSTTSANTLPVSTAAAVRRTPFKRTMEDVIVEQVRSTSPQAGAHLPSLQAKMEEAMAFGGDASRRGKGDDGESKWSSSATANAAGSVAPSGKKGTTVVNSLASSGRSPSTLPLFRDVPSSRSGKRGGDDSGSVAGAMPSLELSVGNNSNNNNSTTVAAGSKPRPPQDRAKGALPSKVEAAIQAQYEQQAQRTKEANDNTQTISMSSAIQNHIRPARGSSPQHVRPPMQLPARNSDGGFNAVDASMFYRAPDPATAGPEDAHHDTLSGSNSQSGSLTTSPRHTSKNNTGSYFPKAQHRPLSPDFELVGMSRKETVAPSVMAGRRGDGRRTGDVTSPISDDDKGGSGVARRQTSPHNNSNNNHHAGPTAAQIIEHARQQIKKSMQSEGPLSLGPSMISSSRAPQNGGNQQLQQQLPQSSRRPGGKTSTAPSSSVNNDSASRQQPQQARALDGAPQIVSPPVTAPAQGRRRSTLAGSTNMTATTREQALAALQQPPLPQQDFSSTLPLMAVGGGGGRLKPLTTMGMPVGASPTPHWASSTPDQHYGGGHHVGNVEDGGPVQQQKWFPPYTSKDDESDIEGVVGTSSSGAGSPRGARPDIDGSSQHSSAKRLRGGTDGSQDTGDDAMNGFGKPTVTTKASVIPVGNPETTDAKQRVHGLVPRRPNGADVMMDMIRRQRTDSVDHENDSVLALGVSGSGVHTNNSSHSQSSPSSSPISGAPSPPKRSGAPPLAPSPTSRRRESATIAGSSPPPSRGGVVILDAEAQRLVNGGGGSARVGN